MRRDCDVMGSMHVLDLATKVSIIETTGLGLTLPTSKPGTAQWSYTISASDMPADCEMLKSYQPALGVFLTAPNGGTVTTTVNGYMEVYKTPSGGSAELIDSQKTGQADSGEYVTFFISIDVDIGDLIEVYMWADVASECEIDEVHGGISIFEVKFHDELVLLQSANLDRAPNFSGMVGSGTSPYLQNGIFSTYNIAHLIDDNPPTFYREDTNGLCKPFYTHPKIHVRINVNRYNPFYVNAFPAYIEYYKLRNK